MPVQPAPLPHELPDAFARSRALEIGVSPRRLRARDLETPFRGVRLRPRLPDDASSADVPLAIDRAERERVLRLARAYDQLMEPHAFFAGRTAAVIYDAPITHGDDLEVAVTTPARAPRRRGIRGLKLQPTLVSLREIHGLRVSSPASTWAMLGRELDVRDLVVVGDWMVRIPRDDNGTRRPDAQLATIGQLRLAENASSRRPGGPHLRAALSLIRVGSASPLETDYRLAAADAGLPEPDLDVEVPDAAGRRIGITEVAYPTYRTLVEIEGDHHRTSRTQWNRDIEKYNAYTAAGWEVVRLTSSHIRGSGARGVNIVHDALVRHGWTPERGE